MQASILVSIGLTALLAKAPQQPAKNAAEITIVNGLAFEPRGKHIEGVFSLGVSSSVAQKSSISGGGSIQLNGIVFQSRKDRTAIDNGVFQAGGHVFSATSQNGQISYFQPAVLGLENIFGTTVAFQLGTGGTSVFSANLPTPPEIFITGPLSADNHNEISQNSILTWNTAADNSRGVLVEIGDVALQGPNVYILTPDDGSLAFADLWPYLTKDKVFTINIKRANWTTVKGTDGRRYGLSVKTASSAVFYKNS